MLSWDFFFLCLLTEVDFVLVVFIVDCCFFSTYDVFASDPTIAVTNGFDEWSRSTTVADIMLLLVRESCFRLYLNFYYTGCCLSDWFVVIFILFINTLALLTLFTFLWFTASYSWRTKSSNYYGSVPCSFGTNLGYYYDGLLNDYGETKMLLLVGVWWPVIGGIEKLVLGSTIDAASCSSLTTSLSYFGRFYYFYCDISLWILRIGVNLDSPSRRIKSSSNYGYWLITFFLFLFW